MNLSISRCLEEEREEGKEGVEGCGVSTDEILQVIGKDSW